MIERYTLPEMGRIWSEENKLKTWLRVELAIIDALSAQGDVPEDAARRIRRAARFDPSRIKQIEEVIKHDVLAFVENVGESLGPDSRYFHRGVTSSDAVYTVRALMLTEASQLVIGELAQLRKVVAGLAGQHVETLTVGRTHGMHAEPTSLGLKFAVWHNDLGRAISRLEAASRDVCVGKVSGAVGNYSHLPPVIEDVSLTALGLRPERPATQVVQRDRHAGFVCALAVGAAVMEKIGIELRNLQRTEIGETEEPFAPGQKGSSSMPHKRNPITLERICGLARMVRSYALAALENVALWHERDISHSSVERVILPDSTTLVHYMARKLRLVLEGLKIDSVRMRSNVGMTGGRVYSQRLMVCLMEAGWERKRAYEKTKCIAEAAARDGKDLKEVAENDDEVVTALGPKVMESIFDPRFYTRYADQILRESGLA